MGVNSFAEALFLSKKFQFFFQTMQNMICLHGNLHSAAKASAQIVMKVQTCSNLIFLIYCL